VTLVQPPFIEFSSEVLTQEEDAFHAYIDEIFVVDAETIATTRSTGTFWLWKCSSGYDRLRYGSVSDLENTFVGHENSIRSILSLNPESSIRGSATFIASASNDKTIRIWDRITAVCIQTLRGHYRGILCMIASQCLWRDENLSITTSSSVVLISGSKDTTIIVWKVSLNASNSQVSEIPHQRLEDDKITDFVNCLCELPEENNTEGGALLIGGYSDGLIRIWRRRRQQRTSTTASLLPFEYYFYKQIATPGQDSVDNLLVTPINDKQHYRVISTTTNDVTLWRVSIVVSSSTSSNSSTSASASIVDAETEIEIVVDRFMNHMARPPNRLIVREAAPGVFASALSTGVVTFWCAKTGTLLWHTNLYHLSYTRLYKFAAEGGEGGRETKESQGRMVAYVNFDTQELYISRVLDRLVSIVIAKKRKKKKK